MKKFILLLTLFLSVNVFADFDKGSKAYDNKDYETAFIEFEKSASQGYAGAQFNLGFLYINGMGVSKNLDKAKYYFEKYLNNPDAEKELKDIVKIPWNHHKLWKY
jgi:TPR repeat protein